MRRTISIIIILLMSLTALTAEKWDSTVAMGLNKTSGNSDTLTLNGSADVNMVDDPHEIRIAISVNHGESKVDGEDETTTDDSKAGMTYKYKIGSPYVYSDSSIFHDNIVPVGRKRNDLSIISSLVYKL